MPRKEIYSENCESDQPMVEHESPAPASIIATIIVPDNKPNEPPGD